MSDHVPPLSRHSSTFYSNSGCSLYGRSFFIIMSDKRVVEQSAKEMPDMKDVTLRMINLHLHASGVFSNVYRGTLLLPSGGTKEVAIKKTWPESRDRNFEMIFLTGVSRERHKNIVQMLFAFSNRSTGDKICESFVFDFMPDTLASVIRNAFLDMVDIKMYTFQLFTGLKYLAQENIAHRDIKPVNILVDHQTGLLKIGDFGSAKIINSNQVSTCYQVTRFYRPPELLLNSSHYNWTVDLWSAGCVVGEMLRKEVLFPGRNVKHQLRLIFTALGIPSELAMKAMRVPTKLEAVPEERVVGTGLKMLMEFVPTEAVDFLSLILVYKPKERLGGSELLRHPFFSEILAPGVRRSNSQLVSSCITESDVREAQSGHERRVNRLSQLMNRKDFDFTVGGGSGGASREEVKVQKTQENGWPAPVPTAAEIIVVGGGKKKDNEKNTR